MSRRIRFFIMGAALILAASVPAAVLAARAPSLGSDLAMPSQGISDSRTVNVVYTITNPTSLPHTFLRRGTPFADMLDGPVFVVDRDGEALPYLGRYVKYMPPTDADYITLAPGESRSVTVNIGEVYDLSVPGTYQVQARASYSGGQGRTAPEAMAATRSWETQLGSNIAEFEISPEAARPFMSLRERAGLARPRDGLDSAGDTFTGCTVEEQAVVEDAIDKACAEATAAATAAQDAVTNAAGDANYVEWWGEFDAGRAATIRDNWNAIRDAICPTGSTKKMEYVCHGALCTPGVYAYVTPGTDPNTIFLCDGFWSAPDVGYDSKPGVLIHEMSHLKAGTDDHRYGRAKCRHLALTNPALAADNADNYEYYAEDLNDKAKNPNYGVIPGVSEWSVAALFALMAVAGMAMIVRRRNEAA